MLNFNFIAILPFMMGLGRRPIRVQRQIQNRESARILEQLSSGAEPPASTGMSDGKEIPPSFFLKERQMICVEHISTAHFRLWMAVAFLLVSLSTKYVQAQVYAGALGGISTLSGDTSALLNSTSTDFSTYNPHNGLALSGLAGKHLSNVFTIQGEYVWNRNPLYLAGSAFDSASLAGYEEMLHSSQQSLFGSVLVYFRNRKSWIRPYLSVGTGWVHLYATEQSITLAQGSPLLPPHSFGANMLALRVPVGADVKLYDGWRIRYTFAETISRNPISHELNPPGPHSLKNFQNLFGIIYQF
jgi:hypothetical protein